VKHRTRLKKATADGTLFLATLTILTLRPVTVPVSAGLRSTDRVEVRACSGSSSIKKPSKKQNKKKPGNSGDAPPAAAGCLEVHSAALDILGFLQSFVRDERWGLTDEQNAEDAWTFVRSLGRDELLGYTKSDANPGRKTWTGGKAFIQVRTLELDGGFNRVQVSANFQGYGQSSDQFAPQRESWLLDSNGSLEARLVSALETHFKSIR
jgi:hypothetical protein